jgi:hypothetical protein
MKRNGWYKRGRRDGTNETKKTNEQAKRKRVNRKPTQHITCKCNSPHIAATTCKIGNPSQQLCCLSLNVYVRTYVRGMCARVPSAQRAKFVKKIERSESKIERSEINIERSEINIERSEIMVVSVGIGDIAAAMLPFP